MVPERRNENRRIGEATARTRTPKGASRRSGNYLGSGNTAVPRLRSYGRAGDREHPGPFPGAYTRFSTNLARYFSTLTFEYERLLSLPLPSFFPYLTFPFLLPLTPAPSCPPFQLSDVRQRRFAILQRRRASGPELATL